MNKKFFVSLLSIILLAMLPLVFASCGDDDEENVAPQEQENKDDNTNNPDDPENQDTPAVKDIIVEVDEEGKANDGHHFTKIDATNFYIDDIKYTASQGNLIVTGYDQAYFNGEANIITTLKYDGRTMNVTEINADAFKNCTVLTSISIPNSITSIGYQAFLGCTNLASVTVDCSTIWSGFESSNLTSIKEVFIGKNVIKIAPRTFYNCSDLTSIVVERGNSNYDSREGCNAIIETATNMLVMGCRNTTIPNSVSSIGVCAFWDCSGLTSIIIPNSVTEIDEDAFSGCFGLKSITIPSSVTKIGTYAFRRCSGLTKAEFASIESLCKIIFDSEDSNPLCYAHNLYVDGKEVTDLIIPNSVTSIGKYTFAGCSSLTSVTIPNSVKSIGSGAFQNCSGLTRAEFASIESLCGIELGGPDANPLYYAHHLYIDGEEVKDLVIPNNVTSIGSNKFYGCSFLTSVTIPNSVTSIGTDAFSKCTSLTSIIIPNSVTEMGDDDSIWNLFRVFTGCTGLTAVTINSNAIASKSYYYSRYGQIYSLGNIFGGQVKNYVFGDEVKSIGNYACYRNSNLTSVTIPESVTSIGSSAFEYCTGLTSINIPNSVTSLGQYAFRGCSGLTSVTVDCSTIGSWFSGLTSIREVTIGSNVTSIGGEAFEYCTGLTSINIPNSVTSIGSYAFSGCTGLTSINIPNSVTSIGNYAFSGCSGLTDIYCYATTPPSVSSNTFYNINNLSPITLHVPAQSVDTYKSKSPWSGFGSIVAIE